jgi:AcrR family transcriptional regulator
MSRIISKQYYFDRCDSIYYNYDQIVTKGDEFMPNETFFNLNDKKRKRIFKVALKEFAVNDYNSASINNIVKEAKISKGSMYQYFENKKDLYLYLLEKASEKKLNFISKNTTKDKDDFFEMLKKMHLEGARFDLTHPKYSKLILNAMNESLIDELGDIGVELKQRSDQYFESYIIEAQKQGKLRSDIDSKLLSFLVSRISMSLIDYVTEQYEFSYRKLIENNINKMPISDEELEDILEDFISVLKTGLKINQPEII